MFKQQIKIKTDASTTEKITEQKREPTETFQKNELSKCFSEKNQKRKVHRIICLHKNK